MKMTRHSKKLILIGALLLLAGLIFTLEPYYTWAQDNNHPCRVALTPEEPLFELERMNPGDTYEETITVTKTGSAPAQLYFAWEWMDGEPDLEEDYNLFDQLHMTIRSEGEVIFEGVMSDWQYDSENPSIDDTIKLTEALGMQAILQGDTITLDFEVFLPGPETGNEYQGAWTRARLVFFTICDSTTVDPEDPGVDPGPEDPDPEDPDPEDPDPEDPPTTVIIPPERPRQAPTPRTDGTSLSLIIAGLLLTSAGIVLRRSNAVANNK